MIHVVVYPHRRIRATLRRGAAALAVVLVYAGSALAHPQQSYNVTVPQPNDAGLQGGLYVWVYLGLTSIWSETNGMPTNGMFADTTGRSDAVGTVGTINPSGRADLGLQLHNVCYGTFPEVTMSATGCVRTPSAASTPGPDCLNFEHGSCLFTYLPWGYFDESAQFIDGTEEACATRGGTFVPKDTVVFGEYDDATVHFNEVLDHCFPPGYGQ